MTFEQFACLTTAYLADLHGYARRLVRTATDAEDLVQGTYERAFASWRTLREPRAVRSWLFRIMLMLFLNQKRQASRYSLLEPGDALDEIPDPALPPDEQVAATLALEQVEAALARMPHSAREVVLLADLWGFEYLEIARILDVPVGTVRSRLHRARAQLALKLGGRSGRKGPGAAGGEPSA